MEIACVADVLEALQATAGSTRWFRGHGDASWALAPSVSRNRGWLQDEAAMLKRFVQEAASRVRERPRHLWEWICLAQHHGVPTRLLDWSENPLVGLYFAVEHDEVDGRPADGCLWAMDPLTLNAEHYDGPPSVLLLDHDDVLDGYLPDRTTHGPRVGALAVLAPRSFDRVVAQSGVFTVFHTSDLRPLDTAVPAAFDTWLVRVQNKERIRNELELFNINSSTVYPDLSHIGERIKMTYGL
jgi:hypothetical protein